MVYIFAINSDLTSFIYIFQVSLFKITWYTFISMNKNWLYVKGLLALVIEMHGSLRHCKWSRHWIDIEILIMSGFKLNKRTKFSFKTLFFIIVNFCDMLNITKNKHQRKRDYYLLWLFSFLSIKLQVGISSACRLRFRKYSNVYELNAKSSIYYLNVESGKPNERCRTV